jgi:hypothetical protein
MIKHNARDSRGIVSNFHKSRSKRAPQYFGYFLPKILRGLFLINQKPYFLYWNMAFVILNII